MTEPPSEAVQSFFGPHAEEEALRHVGDAKLKVLDWSRVG